MKNTIVSQPYFTYTWYWSLVRLGNGGIFSLKAILRKRLYSYILDPELQSWVYLIEFYFQRGGGKMLYCLPRHGLTTAKC